MKKYRKAQQHIEASLIPRKQQALDTLYMIRDIYESDTSDLLTGGMYDEFMSELNTQIGQIKQTIVD